MATNYVQKGERLVLPVASGSVSGDPVVVGSLPAVCLTDRDSDGNAECAIEGVFDIAVTGANNAGNVAVAVGDKLYKDGTEINKDSTNGTEFGIALEAVTSGSTSTINVRLKGC